jgi:hypothetical protein
VILVVVARVDTALKGEPDVNSQIVPNLGTALRINTRSHKADAVIDDKGTGSASHIDSYRASRVWGGVVDDPIALRHRATTLYMNTDGSSVCGGGVNHIVVNHSDTGQITSSRDTNSSGVRRACGSNDVIIADGGPRLASGNFDTGKSILLGEFLRPEK